MGYQIHLEQTDSILGPSYRNSALIVVPTYLGFKFNAPFRPTHFGFQFNTPRRKPTYNPPTHAHKHTHTHKPTKRNIPASTYWPTFLQQLFTVLNNSCGKVMFSQVSVCPRGGRCLRLGRGGCTPPLGRHPQADTPPPPYPRRPLHRRYASYWNAFLFLFIFTGVTVSYQNIWDASRYQNLLFEIHSVR